MSGRSTLLSAVALLTACEGQIGGSLPSTSTNPSPSASPAPRLETCAAPAPGPARIVRLSAEEYRSTIAVLFDAPERMSQFLEEARAENLARIAKAELAAVDPDLLAALARHEDRRAKLTLTWVGDHLYVDRDGDTFDGPVTLGTL